ncbi:MAG: rod shape-determining protein [Deltaproteobacteria bacterium]|nr:MAG: rod shape-determining protein [Deltaproteobacteria bacterium]
MRSLRDATSKKTTADVAIDLGTSNTRLGLRGKGVVVDQPSFVATQAGSRGREVVAIGKEARRMLGRTPANTQVVRPVREGVVADFEATEQLLRHLLRRLPTTTLLRPRLLVCIPSSTTEVERRAVTESARAAGGREVHLVATAVAAAVGAGLSISEAVGNMIVDIGGGRVEVAVTSLGGLVVRRSVPIAGDAMDEAVRNWLRDARGLLVGERTAELLKRRVGSAVLLQDPPQMRIRGRDLETGAPRELDVSANDLVEPLGAMVEQIRDVVLEALRETPPELCADIVAQGVLVCGGSARLYGLTDVLRDATGLPVLMADDPDLCIAEGAARMLDDSALLARSLEVS